MIKKEKDEDIYITSYKRGHGYYYDGEDIEFYIDNKEDTSTERPCVRCGKMPTKEGHDACLGNLPGVIAACCGHGVDEGYIAFKNGITIRGNFNIDITLEEAKNKILKFLKTYHGDIDPFLLTEKLDMSYVLVNYILEELVENGLLYQDK
jgi:hypothetical protein